PGRRGSDRAGAAGVDRRALRRAGGTALAGGRGDRQPVRRGHVQRRRGRRPAGEVRATDGGGGGRTAAAEAGGRGDPHVCRAGRGAQGPAAGLPGAVTRIDALLRAASARVDPADAALLLAHALQRSRAWLYGHGDEAVDAAAAAGFERLLERRVAG